MCASASSRAPYYTVSCHSHDWLDEVLSCHVYRSRKCLIAKFFSRNINMYSQFLSFLHTDTTKVVEILPRVRQGPTLIFKSSCSQYHFCWWPGDARSQDISNHNIDLVKSRCLDVLAQQNQVRIRAQHTWLAPAVPSSGAYHVDLLFECFTNKWGWWEIFVLTMTAIY